MRRDEENGTVTSTQSGAGMDKAEFNELLARARSGDDQATVLLLKAFEADVRLMVRHQLPRRMRSQFDSLDFCQAVWQTDAVFTGEVLAVTEEHRGTEVTDFLSSRRVRVRVVESFRGDVAKDVDVFTTFNGFLNSCAIPPAILPMAANRSAVACRRWYSDW